MQAITSDNYGPIEPDDALKLKETIAVLKANLEAEKMAGRELARQLEDARAEIALLKAGEGTARIV
jgi:hypothetical protein